MPITSSASSLIGLPLTTLKTKAFVHPDPKLPILQWVRLANEVYQAAVEADEQQSTELAYVEYFKAAGILQVILNHPGFKTLKNHPASYRIYQEVAPKVLASTTRARQLAEVIERQQPSNLKTRPISGGISSRIKSLEAAGLAGAASPQSPTSPPPKEDHNLSPSYSSSSGRRPLPVPPGQNGITTRTNFINTVLESQSTIRSGSAPPELIADAQSSSDLHSPSDGLSEDMAVDLDSLEKTLRSLRSPSEFDQAFPKLENLQIDDSRKNGLSSFPEMPSVPSGMPRSFNTTLPPPPEPFSLPNYESPKQSNLSSDKLVNDTSLGASLTRNTDLDPQSGTSPPPPYPNFDTDQINQPQTPQILQRSHAIKNGLHRSGPGNFSNHNSPHSSPKKHTRTFVTPNQEPPPSLPSGSNELLPAVLVDYFRKMSAAGLETSVLFLDIRNREDFEACRIKSQDVVCIEPIVLTKNSGIGVSSADIEESLVISPPREQMLFERRQEFEYVILYDKRSVQLPSDPNLMYSKNPTDVAAKLLLILYLAIHKQAYMKRLKNPPMLLSGGLEGWAKIAGQSGVVGKGSSPANVPRTSLTHSSINGTPIVFRQTHSPDESGNIDGTSDVKRARRRIALLQGDSPTNQPDIVRSVADLTRPGLGSSTSTTSLHSINGSGPSNYFHPRHPNGPYLSNGYQSPIGVNSPITLPEQTLQRKTSQPTYDTPLSSIPPDSASTPYSTNTPMHIPSAGYHIPSVPPQPALYGSHTPAYHGYRPTEPNYNGYIPDTLRPTIQYPHFNHPRSGTDPNLIMGRPPQPPPPALAPGGGVPNYYNLPAYSSNLGLDKGLKVRETPPVTPYSPNTHGSTEVYFNSSFEDGQVGMTGLKNLGNTCYMNSTLQCISATIPLARFFKDGSYKRCINRVNPLGTKGALAETVAELVRMMWSAQYTFVSPTIFREAICRFAPQFRGSDQHDAQEFLGFLLDGLHEDLNLVTHKPAPIEMSSAREAELEALPTQLASAREWEIYKRRDNSVIVELFQGQYRSRLQCLTCGTTSTTYNTFMYLSLPIPTGRGMSKVSLTQCLDAFLKEEIMEKDDAWNCPKCKTRRKATKRLSIARLPPILLIHLKRFSFKGPFSDKLEAFVQYPLYGLDLTNYIPAPLESLNNHHPSKKSSSKNGGGGGGGGPSTVYDLYAVCNHFGSLSSGHWIFL
ncbi:ubiquitin-specific protease [Melampsora larici-populina 98AG31]|uniref:ubiquitinyl hydrolase 1 n=1 Tax=Melampsora larici-populina (strain 98AG31 / pathotype 3-4-7) TaxID=747676 RepID=F4R6Z7_MELLP|nr:ubiquitin-specific protease [Melampsora larici-populina 98AG31]EGG12365.1 ubiquitin-specific protease [Melampsora larici-populina 98AG31]